MPTNNKEEAFAELVREYENSWVAIVEEDGKECVVGHGSTAVEAANEATVKGYPQVLLFRVPSLTQGSSTSAGHIRVYFAS